MVCQVGSRVYFGLVEEVILFAFGFSMGLLNGSEVGCCWVCYGLE